MTDCRPYYLNTVILLIIIGVITWFIVRYEWRSDLIERGIAQYCPADGSWAFIGECKA